jgi:hypothetical protein
MKAGGSSIKYPVTISFKVRVVINKDKEYVEELKALRDPSYVPESATTLVVEAI